MRWNMSAKTILVWNLAVAAVIAVMFWSAEESVAGAAAVFVAIAAAGGLEAALERPRKRRSTRDRLLSMWDFTGSPYALIAGAVGWHVLFSASWAESLGFATVLTLVEAAEDAAARRRNAPSASDGAAGQPSPA